MSVAVIGLGEIGRAITRRLLATGHDVLACDRLEGALAEAASAGAGVTTKASDCADSDVVLIVVADDAQVRDVIQGANGLFEQAPLDKPPLVVVMSTVSVEVVRELADYCRERGSALVDAPLSGGAIRALDGTLTLMAGGESSDVDKARTVLDAVAKEIFYCGPVGAGALIKIINNLICASSVYLSAEAYRLAAENGVPLRELLPVLEASSGRTFLTSDLGYAVGTYAGIASTRELFDHTVVSMQKDVRLARGLAKQSEGTYPMLDGLAATLQGLGEESFETWSRVGRQARSRADSD